MTNLTQLIDRLQAIEDPIRDVDNMIWRWVNDNQVGIKGWQYDLKEAPKYTESVDEILALITIREYDWVAGNVNGQVGGTPYACVGSLREHYGCTAAASLCLAFFRLEHERADK